MQWPAHLTTRTRTTTWHTNYFIPNRAPSEGTRSKTGQLGEFKKGGFMLALSTETPILPCTVVGTRDVMPIKAATLYPSRTIDVTFHEPIDVKEYGIERRDELMERVRVSIDSALP